MDILHLIDRLEETIKASKHVGNWRLVDERRIWSLLDQMRISIPDEVRRAERVVRERDRTLAQAHEEAERIIALARSEAAQLTAEHAVARSAEEHAQAVRQRVEREADAIRAGADSYAFEVLCNLEQEVRRALTVIENGIRKIQMEREQRESKSPTTRGSES